MLSAQVNGTFPTQTRALPFLGLISSYVFLNCAGLYRMATLTVYIISN